MTIEHNLMTDPSIHEPKGITTASASQVYLSDGVGSGSWTNQVEQLDPKAIQIETLFTATSTALNQQPVTTDTVLQLEFGNGQLTVSDPAMIATNGTITFNDAGTYRIDLTAHYGRTGGAGTAVLMTRQLINGTQVGDSLASKLTNADVYIPFSTETWFTIPASTTLTYEIVRDSAGDNSGGLFQQTNTLGWNAAPSASIQVSRLI